MLNYIIDSKGSHHAIDLVGRTFNRLTVIGRAPNATSGNAQWLCRCSCGNTTVVQSYKLRKGLIKSCGCLTSEVMKAQSSKQNKFIVLENITIGFTDKSEPFVFDTDKLDLVKQYYWSITNKGYVKNIKHNIFLHKLVTNTSRNQTVDHINHLKWFNCLSNLRVCSSTQNMWNSKRYVNNSSGRTGVYKVYGKWRAKINCNHKDIHLGMFSTFKEAIKAREQAELKYFGQYTNMYK
jgi:hypothetical protein